MRPWFRGVWAPVLTAMGVQVDWTLGGLGGHAHALSVEPAKPHRLAVGCGDGTIRITPTGARTDGGEAPESKMIWQVGSCDYPRSLPNIAPYTQPHRHRFPIRSPIGIV